MEVSSLLELLCLPTLSANKMMVWMGSGVLFTVLLQILGQAMHQILDNITCQPQHWGNTPSRSPWHFLMCRTLGSVLQLLCRATWCYVCLLTECHTRHKWNNTENNKNTARNKYTNTHKQRHVHETQLHNGLVHVQAQAACMYKHHTKLHQISKTTVCESNIKTDSVRCYVSWMNSYTSH